MFLRELVEKVSVADTEAPGVPEAPMLKRMPSLRQVPPEAIHYTAPFSAVMDEILEFPQYRTPPGSMPGPCLYLGSLIATKSLDSLQAHECRFVLTLLDTEESPYETTMHTPEPEPAHARAPRK
jgi:hypothetical protein